MFNLFPDDVKATLPSLYSQEHENDPMVYVKFYFPAPDGWIWYAYEGEQRGTDFLFFGWVVGWEKELGYFSLRELENIAVVSGILQVTTRSTEYFNIHEIDFSHVTILTVIRDETFIPMRLSEVKKQHEEE